MNSSNWWICGRCYNHNPSMAGICQNPNCGGEPVSRTIEARSERRQPVRSPLLQHRHDGQTRLSDFDEAQEQCFATSNRGKRLAVYPCPAHGYHIGSNRANAA